ncbi:hypothetical protein B296_00050374 [Ensete ventricosum]|uniref:Uncharacterized protein n=1 Tax=Ensete ventricosum TaxID=4639 RepID=A0A426Y1X1_ENSVE|nr:hypothetical protein B296_00050374 [Ensete ventricosum]
MLSKSCGNLLELGSDNTMDFSTSVKSHPRVMTSPGIINDLDEGTSTNEDSCSSKLSSEDRKIIVADFLPLNSMKDQATGQWCFTWDQDSLLLQLKDGFSSDTEVIYIGCLDADIDISEQEEVSQQLWPLFHYMLPICLHKGDLFDRSLFQAYISANKKFAEKVMEVINSDDDYVWIHDYYLMLLPTFLRKRLKMLGLHYESKRGYIGLEYYGRTVSIKILSVGIHMGRLQSVLNHPATASKLLAFELLLERHPTLREKIILVQIVNPTRSMGKDVKEAIEDTLLIAERINNCYGTPGYEPVVLIDKSIPFHEKIAFYVAAECCIVNATSTLIVSEFVGCSPSLSGAFRVNPWSIEDVSNALYRSINSGETERQMRHEKHYRYVSTHDVAHWAHSFSQDLERACKDHYSWRKLMLNHLVSSYNNTHTRAIFLDYDGTIMPEASVNKTPRQETLSVLNSLSRDPNNTVFIVSGRGRASLNDWFTSCESLGIAAEHGYFIRWRKDAEWESSSVPVDLDWMKIAEPVMQLYTETTDGSYIELKESAIVWHHQYADHDYGSCQATELLDHLESVLANEPVVVKRGQHIVEVKPQGIGKGLVVENLIGTLNKCGKPLDFVLCIGDDRSDEDMFESINNSIIASSNLFPSVPEVFACTVGQKPSMAKYYVEDTSEVIRLLQGIAAVSNQESRVTYNQVPLEGAS